MILEVDGTLSNPFVVVTVTLWSLALSAFSYLVATRWNQRQRNKSERLRLVALLLLLVVATPLAQFELGNLLYKLEALFTPGPGITSVGFWGGPPVFPAWVAATAAYMFAIRRKERTQ